MRTANHGSSMWPVMFVTALAGIACGCARNSTSHEVRPGEVDFPRENSSPTHRFRFEAVLPPRISVRFKLVYTALVHSDFKPGELPRCHYVTDTGQMLPFTVSVPLPLKFEKSDPDLGEYYSGTVTVDRYVPGRCRWELTAAMYSLDGDPRHDVPLFHYSQFPDYARDSPKVRNCTRVPSSYRPNTGIAPIVCAVADPTDIIATAERLAAQRPPNLDAGNLGVDVTEIGGETLDVSFAFWDIDNPLPSGEVNVTLQSSPAPAGIIYPTGKAPGIATRGQ